MVNLSQVRNWGRGGKSPRNSREFKATPAGLQYEQHAKNTDARTSAASHPHIRRSSFSVCCFISRSFVVSPISVIKRRRRSNQTKQTNQNLNARFVYPSLKHHPCKASPGTSHSPSKESLLLTPPPSVALKRRECPPPPFSRTSQHPKLHPSSFVKAATGCKFLSFPCSRN